MKYWLYGATIEGLQISAYKTVNYVTQEVYADATNKEGEVSGNLNDDYPLFSGIAGQVFSQRLINEIANFDPEGVIYQPITLKLPDGSFNNNWCKIVVSAHVDCIDFKSSTLKMDEDGSIRRIKKLVLNEEKADRAGYDIFRLHDEFPRIVISDRIKQAIESVNPTGICFEPTDGSDPDWY
ncbi:MAG: imm11 family protein [Marinomonas foliarum]